MFLIIAGLVFAVWLFYSGWRFYQSIDWDEPAEPSPDLRAMHMKQAELQHIQSVLAEARDRGKLSQSVVDEFARYCEAEIAAMQSVETSWKYRRSKNPA